jgi:glycosyltransferase involved in cell wall biosynthesis
MTDSIKKKICFVITAEFVVRAFLINHLKALSDHYDITVLVNTNNPNFLSELGVDVELIPLKISRNIHPISDLSVLLKLIVLFKKKDFDAVHSVTPKAGLLAMFAGKLANIPLRIHTFTGQVWATKVGFMRYVLKKIDTFFASLATHLIVDSPSQLNFLLDEKVVPKNKCYVFGKGSVSGVDLKRFIPNLSEKLNKRIELNIPADALVFLFLGRLTEDKGVLDLAEAFKLISNNSTYLLFVGPDEQDIKTSIESILVDKLRFVRFINYTNTPEKIINVADILMLPSYREGFGTVVIEAAAAGIPTIASRIYGVVDTIVENETGLLHESKNITEIYEKMSLLANDNELRIKLGKNARQRVLEDFDCNRVTHKWSEFYSNHLLIKVDN